jgi:hypothetical protein
MWQKPIFQITDEAEPIVPPDKQFLIGGLWLFFAVFAIFIASLAASGDWVQPQQIAAVPFADSSDDNIDADLLAPDLMETGSIGSNLPKRLNSDGSPMPSPVTETDAEIEVPVKTDLVAAEMTLISTRVEQLSQQVSDLLRRQEVVLARYADLQQANIDLSTKLAGYRAHRHDPTPVAPHGHEAQQPLAHLHSPQSPAAHEHDWVDIFAEHLPKVSPEPEVETSSSHSLGAPAVADPVAGMTPENFTDNMSPPIVDLTQVERTIATPLFSQIDDEEDALQPLSSPIPLADPISTGSLPSADRSPSLFSVIPQDPQATPPGAVPDSSSFSPIDPSVPRARPERILATHTSFGVKIGRYGDSRGAADQWRRLREFFPTLVEGKSGLSQAGETIDNVSSYSLVFGPFANASDAATACGSLQSNGLQCSTANYTGDLLGR